MLFVLVARVLRNYMCRAGRNISIVIAVMSLLLGGAAQAQFPRSTERSKANG